MESLDRRAKQLVRENLPAIQRTPFLLYQPVKEREGYLMATKEHLPLHQKSLEYMQHKPGCISNMNVSNGMGLSLPSCTCGLAEHQAHLSSLLGDQLTM